MTLVHTLNRLNMLPDFIKEGYAKWIIPSGGVSVKRDKWPGVPASAIIGEDQSGHTRDNAFLSRKAADERGLEIKSALIVCKAFHARRCLMLYQMAFPAVKIKVCPVHCYNITKENWYQTEAGIDRVLGELTRCGNQFAGDIKEYLRQEQGTEKNPMRRVLITAME